MFDIHLEFVRQVLFPAILSVGILPGVHPVPDKELEFLECFAGIVLHQFAVVGEQLQIYISQLEYTLADQYK